MLWDGMLQWSPIGRVFDPLGLIRVLHGLSRKKQLLGELTRENAILVLPETYLGINLASFRGLNLSKMSRVIFNQNAYYSYGDFSSGISDCLDDFYESKSVLQVLSISEDTHAFLARNLGIADSRLSRIVNSIEPIFDSDQPKSNRMHWMPRKNPQHVQAVIQGLQRSGLNHIGGWQGEPLQDLSHAQVAHRLNGARLFLAFGHPEGFGLPFAEAMAAGCWVVGYSGGGGANFFVWAPPKKYVSVTGLGSSGLCKMLLSASPEHPGKQSFVCSVRPRLYVFSTVLIRSVHPSLSLGTELLPSLSVGSCRTD